MPSLFFVSLLVFINKKYVFIISNVESPEKHREEKEDKMFVTPPTITVH